jgi:hypothetical protein
MELMKSWKLIVVALSAIAAAPTGARAQSSTAQAETLFRQGKDLMAHGRIAEACAAFDASQKLDPTIATLLNQASCREKNGQLASAWGLFLDAERQSRSASDDAGRQLHQVATDHAGKLEPRLSTLTITVASENRVRGLEILRNNEPVDPGAWNKALPVDGGTYKITARAPGNAEWSSSVTVSPERDAKTIETPRLKAAALSSTSAPAGAPATSRAQVAPPPPEHRSRLVPLIFGGAALALGGGAIVFELSARSDNDKIATEHDNTKRDALWSSANNKRYAAEGFGVASVACAGVAVWLLLRSGPDAESTSTSVQARLLLQPIVGSDHAGLVLSGGF